MRLSALRKCAQHWEKKLSAAAWQEGETMGLKQAVTDINQGSTGAV